MRDRIPWQLDPDSARGLDTPVVTELGGVTSEVLACAADSNRVRVLVTTSEPAVLVSPNVALVYIKRGGINVALGALTYTSPRLVLSVEDLGPIIKEPIYVNSTALVILDVITLSRV